jgi:hypothetical protein
MNKIKEELNNKLDAVIKDAERVRIAMTAGQGIGLEAISFIADAEESFTAMRKYQRHFIAMGGDNSGRTD